MLAGNDQALAYVYARETAGAAGIANLTMDEARRIAATSQSCRNCYLLSSSWAVLTNSVVC